MTALVRDLRASIKKTGLVTAALVILFSAALQGCGGSSAGSTVGTFLNQLKAGQKKAARAVCYDDISYKEMTDKLTDSIYAMDVTIVSSTRATTAEVRKQGVPLPHVQSVEERIAPRMAGIDARYKPLIDAATSELNDAQAGLKAAEAQLAYSRVTYANQGRSQIYKDENLVVAARARVSRAQSKLDTLNSQRQAEVQAVRAPAEAQFKSDMDAHQKELASATIALPVSRVQVVFSGDQGSKQTSSFTVVNTHGVWKVLSS